MGFSYSINGQHMIWHIVDNSLSVAWWAGGGHGRPVMVIRGTEVQVTGTCHHFQITVWFMPIMPDLFYCCCSKTFENAISGNLETPNFQNSLTWCQPCWCLAAVVSQITYMFPRSSTVHAVLCSTLYNLIYRIVNIWWWGVGGTSIKTDLRGCLYGSEPAWVPELANSLPQDEFHHTFTWNFWGGLTCENKYKFSRENLGMHTKTLF
jgi:hypothetical protein